MLKNRHFGLPATIEGSRVKNACPFWFSKVRHDSVDARRMQGPGGHVSSAAAARSRCQLQPARVRIHGSDVRWSVRYSVEVQVIL